MAECSTPNCKNDNGWYSISGFCDGCKTSGRKTIFLVCSLLAILGILIGGIIGAIHFDYEKGKCSNLKSTESSYDFDYKLEIDANYNQDCYFINNHPLALIASIFYGGFFGLIIPIFIGVFWSMRYSF